MQAWLDIFCSEEKWIRYFLIGLIDIDLGIYAAKTKQEVIRIKYFYR